MSYQNFFRNGPRIYTRHKSRKTLTILMVYDSGQKKVVTNFKIRLKVAKNGHFWHFLSIFPVFDKSRPLYFLYSEAIQNMLIAQKLPPSEISRSHERTHPESTNVMDNGPSEYTPLCTFFHTN